MKVTDIEIVHVRPRYSFLLLHTDEGLTGCGEAIVEGRSRTVETAVRELKPLLIGQDPRNIEHLWQVMYKGTFYRGGPVLCSAISGIEQAMWDVLGKSLGVPVYTLLGGAVRRRIKLYKHVDGDTADDLREMARSAVAAGFRMIKTALDAKAHLLEPPAYLIRQVERMEALRDAIGPAVDFAIDFHGRVGPAMAIKLAKELERFSPMFIEEPCLPENADALAAVARATSIPIAAGERLFTRWGFREVLEKQAAAIVQPDLAHCGGIMEAKKIAAMAEVYYAGFAPHNPLGPINLAASLQLAANTPNFLAQEHRTLGEEYLKSPFEVKDGYIDLPTAPGLGIELDEDKIARMKYPGDWETPIWYHEDDGSFAEW